MALQCRKGSPTTERALVLGYNAMRATVAVSGSKYHADVTSNTTTGDFLAPAATAAVSVAATAADLPTVLVLANELQKVYNNSLLDAVAHKVADVTNTSTAPAATDQGTANTLLNDIQT